MTMFSQKAPLDLTEFLSKPATTGARRLTATRRRSVLANCEEAIAAPEIKLESRVEKLKPSTKA